MGVFSVIFTVQLCSMMRKFNSHLGADIIFLEITTTSATIGILGKVLGEF